MATKIETNFKNITAQATETTEKATAIIRKGVLAYVGLHGAAYDRAQERFTEARKSTDGLFDKWVEKGEEMETQATEYFKTTQEKMTETYKDNVKKARTALPFSANDRVEELEAEIAALNKKIVAMSKKVRPAKKAVKAKKPAVKTAPAATAPEATATKAA